METPTPAANGDVTCGACIRHIPPAATPAPRPSDTGARRAPAPYADPYTPRPYGAPRDPSAMPARGRAMRHVTERVPGASAVTSRVRVSPSTPAPRLRPLRDTVPLRTVESASRAMHGVRHTYVTGPDGFARDARTYRDPSATVHMPTAVRVPVTHDDGSVTIARMTDAPTTPAPSAVHAASAAAITVGDTDRRHAVTSAVVTLRDGTTHVAPVDANGRHVRTVGDDAPWTDRDRTVVARPAPRPAPVTDRPDPVDTPPARVSSAVVDMWIRATGYAGPITGHMRSLARDAMAAQRQRDAYAGDDD